MIEEKEAVKGARFFIVRKSIGVSLKKAGMCPNNIVVIDRIQNNPWTKKDGGSILACKEGAFQLYTFLPKDFVSLS